MMKRALIVAGLLMTPLMTDVATANDYQIAVVRKKAGAQRAKPGQSGDQLKSTETVFYEVSVTNRAFGKESKDLEARYILAVERQELGSKQGEEHIERVRGTSAVPAAKSGSKVDFKTDEVTLREQSLAGNYVFRGGGRIRTRDGLSGIWVRLYDGDTMVGEYINPTTLANKIQWD